MSEGLQRRLGIWTAVFSVFAGMIGSGIFGNTGKIHEFVGSPGLVILLWAFYGLVALSGALCYAELASRMPHPGGEYVYLRNIFGPLPSFLTGWVSFLVGFAAPAAIAAILSAKYMGTLLDRMLPPGHELTILFASEWVRKGYAALLLIFFTVVHGLNVRRGGYIQNILTVVKLGIILMFAVAGLTVVFQGGGNDSKAVFDLHSGKWEGVGLGLLWVLFAFSGWNSAAYLAGEIKNPEKNVPRALFWGTLLTTLIYVTMNILYYLALPSTEISGSLIVAAQASRALFGPRMAVLFNAAFCLILLSTISALVMIGPRVYFAMARDGVFFSFAGKIHPRFETPLGSILIQLALALIYLFSGTYYNIMTYLGFALSIFPILTMVALIRLRLQRPEVQSPYRTPLFPLIPLFFIAVSIYIMVASFIEDPGNGLVALAVVLLGVPVFYFWKGRAAKRSESL